MTDNVFMVRFPCPHGKWFRHPINPRAAKWEWCDDGRTKWLELVDVNPFGGDVYQEVSSG